MHYDKVCGARLGQKRFSSGHIGKIMQRKLIDGGLAVCVDLDSWKPKGGDVRTAKARGYIPCFDLLWANVGTVVVSSLAQFDQQKAGSRNPLHKESILFYPCEASGVVIPANVAAAFQLGTGLICDQAALYRLVTALCAEKRASKLGAALSAVGYALGEEISPVWRQHEFGRIYSGQPAAINMPTALLGALRSSDELPLWSVDFSNFELRIACKECGQAVPQGDCYAFLGSNCGLDRETIKAVVNPLLHGQTMQQIRYGNRTDFARIRDRRLVEDEIKSSLPLLYAGLTRLQRDSAILQRSGASIFFPCMSVAMSACGIQRVGLPKHDGWVFSGTSQQAHAVKRTMEVEATRLTGEYFPAKLERIA